MVRKLDGGKSNGLSFLSLEIVLILGILAVFVGCWIIFSTNPDFAALFSQF